MSVIVDLPIRIDTPRQCRGVLKLGHIEVIWILC